MECCFDPVSGTFDRSKSVEVSHERCWSVSPLPSDEMIESRAYEYDWLAAVVGFEPFAVPGGTSPTAATPRAAIAVESSRVESSQAKSAPLSSTQSSQLTSSQGGAVLSLGCGIELRGAPGLLEVILTSGARALNGYQQIVVKRSWVGDGGEAGASVFTEVEVVDDMTGDK